MVAPALAENMFFWNVSYAVGRGKPNRLDDVELVRYGFNCMRNTHGADLGPEGLAYFPRLKIFGPFGDDLHEVIVFYQKMSGHPQDGCVRPTPQYAPRLAGLVPTIVGLNMFMRRHEGEIYPRIERSNATGAEVSRVCAQFFE